MTFMAKTSMCSAMAAVCWFGSSAPAQAGYACAVKKTRDGYVALRQGPSAKQSEIARMKAQELVGLLHPGRDDIVRQGDWLFVRWYPNTRRTPTHIPEGDETKARTGWVRDSLIDCFQ